MSNHFSADNLKFPGDDARLDFTDLFVFQAPSEHHHGLFHRHQPGKTVLIMDSNPFLTGPGFHPDAVYRINIDNDGDAYADVAFSFVFSPQGEGGAQTCTAYHAAGAQARQAEPAGQVLIAGAPVGFGADAQPVQAGPVRLFAGVRSDPFFADAEGALHGFQWTGVDTFAGKNILSIALEVPGDMLGDDPVIGAWATISLRRDGTLVQMDRGGHPTINPFINPDGEKNTFNARQPADDVANYLAPWSELLRDKGGYSPDEAEAAALLVLPDILRYDRTQPAHYPNGRVLTDDVYSARFAWLTNGKITSDGLKPHDDLLGEFPYLGPPNS
jgi:Domain of unknown function (DUF4331)